MLLLDTNIISLALRGDATIQRHLARTDRRRLAISAITWAELEYGSRRAADPDRNRTAWQRFLRGVPVLSFTRNEAVEHARLRDSLRDQPIGERDLLIAAIAVTTGFTVVTRNVREFRRVKGLKVEDWVTGR